MDVTSVGLTNLAIPVDIVTMDDPYEQYRRSDDGVLGQYGMWNSSALHAPPLAPLPASHVPRVARSLASSPRSSFQPAPFAR